MIHRNDLKHLFLSTSPHNKVYRYNRGGGSKVLTPRQHKLLHAQRLKNELEAAIKEHLARLDKASASSEGLCLEITGSTDHPLRIDDLESKRPPIEILNIKASGDAIHATVLIPQGKEQALFKKLDAYGKEEKKLPLIDSIESLRLADMESFWIDSTDFPQDRNAKQSWEVWLRRTALSTIQEKSSSLGITLSKHALHFQECSIVLVYGSINALETLHRRYIALQGFKYREASPHFFDSLSPAEQSLWRDELKTRIIPAPDASPAVAILDTGVQRENVLLADSIAVNDMHTYDPDWGTQDHAQHGHGTGMAGLALFGDITHHLVSSSNHQLFHRVESVKILPPSGQNPEELYGVITRECVARTEVEAPHRPRVFCMAVTSDGYQVGHPSSWSATIDALAFGSESNEATDSQDKRFFCISAGNTTPNKDAYPANNDTSPIENPAQSWNSLCVGGITHKSFADDTDLHTWHIVASPGGLAPSSRTSVAWSHKDTPIKPEIVLEAGNYATDGSLCTNHADLSVLTAGRNSSFSYLADTSAATALASRMAAMLQAEYPDYWPETIRALLVHSARWNEVMLGQRSLKDMKAADKQTLLRRFGYGEPALQRARYSASNRACLVIQSSLQPFHIPRGKDAQYHEMHLHTLPWPEAFLQELGEQAITLRITLSFFIEPNPSERLPSSKYDYPSYRLCFDMQRASEDIDTFIRRISKVEDEPETTSKAPSTSRSEHAWGLGTQVRDKGSVISDVWFGTAADLALQNHVAIIPRNGWWKKRPALGKAESQARYALILSLECEDQTVDLYSAIKSQIGLMTATPVDT